MQRYPETMAMSVESPVFFGLAGDRLCGMPIGLLEWRLFLQQALHSSQTAFPLHPGSTPAIVQTARPERVNKNVHYSVLHYDAHRGL